MRRSEFLIALSLHALSDRAHEFGVLAGEVPARRFGEERLHISGSRLRIGLMSASLLHQFGVSPSHDTISVSRHRHHFDAYPHPWRSKTSTCASPFGCRPSFTAAVLGCRRRIAQRRDRHPPPADLRNQTHRSLARRASRARDLRRRHLPRDAPRRCRYRPHHRRDIPNRRAAHSRTDAKAVRSGPEDRETVLARLQGVVDVVEERMRESVAVEAKGAMSQLSSRLSRTGSGSWTPTSWSTWSTASKEPLSRHRTCSTPRRGPSRLTPPPPQPPPPSALRAPAGKRSRPWQLMKAATIHSATCSISLGLLIILSVLLLTSRAKFVEAIIGLSMPIMRATAFVPSNLI